MKISHLSIIDLWSRIVSIFFLTLFLSIQANSLNSKDFEFLLFIGTLVSLAPLLDLGSRSTFQRFLSSIRTEKEKTDLLSLGLRYLRTNALILISQSCFSSIMLVYIVRLTFDSFFPFSVRISVYLFFILVINFLLNFLKRFFEIISKSSWYFSIQALSTLFIIIRILLSHKQPLDFTFFLQELVMLHIVHSLGSLFCLMKISHRKSGILGLQRVNWREFMDVKIQSTQLLFLLSFVLLNGVHFESNSLELNTGLFQFYQRLYTLLVAFMVSYLIGFSFASTTRTIARKSLLRKSLTGATFVFLVFYALGHFGILDLLGFPSLDFWNACAWSVLVTIQVYNSWFVIDSFVSRQYLAPFLAALLQFLFVFSIHNFDNSITSSLERLFFSQFIFFVTIQSIQSLYKWIRY